MDNNHGDLYHISTVLIIYSLLSREFENIRHTPIVFWWFHSCVISAGFTEGAPD